VEKAAPNTFRAIEKDFVPKKNLTVFFFPVAGSG
jgi:hypothetical protein